MRHRAAGNWDSLSCTSQGAAWVWLSGAQPCWCRSPPQRELWPGTGGCPCGARHSIPALEKCSSGEGTGDSFLPGQAPDMAMSQGLTEKMPSPISQSREARVLSTKLSSRKEGLCHAELLPKASADLLAGNLLMREHQPLVLPRVKLCFPSWSWLEGKGDQIRAADDEDQIWMLGKPETPPSDTHWGV